MTCLSNIKHTTKLLGRLSQPLLNTTVCSTRVSVSGFSTSAVRNMDISGIYPPIATPFNEDETIAYDKLQHNMDKWNKIPLRGIIYTCILLYIDLV